MLVLPSMRLKQRVTNAVMANTKIKTLNQVASRIAMLVPQSMLLKRRALPVHLVNIRI
jgi:hypothetical protein